MGTSPTIPLPTSIPVLVLFLPFYSKLEIEVAGSPEMLTVVHQNVMWHIPEDSNFQV
jgi:hypothetical protein